ncbi:YezD family protein [Aquisediminimonas sediminicola]|uniref:YezD family protein n=1 Tax=Alteraquisediminimonas sediminicola TaxID=2676787 RepID=UPI001C8E8912|nr:YezD family protein [Aquisediminimonas sediminicola]
MTQKSEQDRAEQERAKQDLSSEDVRILNESLNSVREALEGLRFGNVSLTVHEGRVVQIDVTEKKRLKPH